MADIVSRAKALIMQPEREWAVIAEEPADIKGLFLNYAAILSLIPVVCGLIVSIAFAGMLVGGYSFGWVLSHTILRYIVGLAMVWVVGKIIQVLAPNFGGVNDEIAAMKLSVYSPTASWVASVFVLIPLLGWLAVLVGVVYSVYVFYLGVTPIAKVPAEKAVVFTAAVAVASIVLGYISSVIVVRLLIGF